VTEHNKSSFKPNLTAHKGAACELAVRDLCSPSLVASPDDVRFSERLVMTYPSKTSRTGRLSCANNYFSAQLTSVFLLFAILTQPILVYRWHSLTGSALAHTKLVDLGASGNVKLPPQPGYDAGVVNEADRARAIEQYGNLPLCFERQREQKNETETFLSRQSGFMVSVNSSGAVFAMRRPSTSGSNLGTPHPGDHERAGISPASQYDILRMALVSANNHSPVVALKELPGKVNYFIGANPNEWKRDMPTYGAVRYGEVYPGIDLEYYGNHRQLEYDFIVAPGADPRAIRMSFEGVSRIVVEKNGTLVLENPAGQLRQQRPLAYQTISLVRKEVAARYVVKKGNQVSIELGNYDSSRPIVIDPVFVYSTYLGGGSDDIGFAVTMDSVGNAYVAGRTLSTNFPTVNPLLPTNSGLRDIFVTKLNSSGTSLVYSTFIGGSGDDLAFGIATNSSNEAYLAGWTSSANFPLANALQPTYGGGNADAFLVRLNANGNALISSTYAGGTGDDVATKIALDSARNIYGIGYTNSTDLVTLNAIQPVKGAGFDAFLIKLTPAADSILFSTYAGGNGNDFGLGLAVDSAGSVYAIGDSESTDLVTVNALQPLNAGGFDAFLAKLTPAGNGIVFATYAGGNGDDSGQAISLDGSANIYAVGYTNSTNLQLIVNAVQPIKGAGYDAFLAKLNTSGTSVIYSTFLGGNNTDAAYAVASDTAGNSYITGETSSTNFHRVNSLRNSAAGGRDVFVTKLNPSGSTILFSTYLGGGADEVGNAIAADDSGAAYITGGTLSLNFSTSTPLQPRRGGGMDAFISKLDTTAASPPPNTVQFAATGASISEVLDATTKIDIPVTRIGDTSAAAAIDYATLDGTASERSDYLAAFGRLTFAPGQTSSTITVFIVDDRFAESPETFSVNLSTPVGCTFGSPSTFTVTINSNEAVNGLNPVKDASFNTDFFVRQHYLDFLNREPDAGGLAFWKDQIDSCATQECREIRRINVSAAFFLSIEFQQTGYLVERLYKTAYGSATGTSTLGGSHQLPVPIVRLNEFLADTQQIGRGVVFGQPGDTLILENNKQTLIAEFVVRPRFLTAFPLSITPAQFVDALNANAEGALSPTERDQLVADLTSGAKTRAQVLRAVAEDADLVNSENNRAFVLAQYLGYLRRNPNDTPDLDYSGYDFWLGKLNQFNGNFVNAEMVKAFIVSAEYQQRFGP
jgi:hypothetical protein